METIAAVLIISSLAAAYEFHSLRRQGRSNELWVFSLLLLLGSALAIAHSLDTPLPNPLNWIVTVFTPASSWFNAILS